MLEIKAVLKYAHSILFKTHIHRNIITQHTKQKQHNKFSTHCFPHLLHNFLLQPPSPVFPKADEYKTETSTKKIK